MQDTSKMTPKELYSYRVKLYRDAMSFKKPDRIPINANMFTWMFLDAGYSPTKAARSYDMINDSMIKFVKKYKVDGINYLNSGYRNPFVISDSLGGSDAYTDQNAESLNVIVEDLMYPDEYEEVLTQFPQWLYRKFLQKFPAAKDFTVDRLMESMKIHDEFFANKTKSIQMMRDEYGITGELNFGYYMSAFEDLFSLYRGLKGVSMDLRRKKKEVEHYVEVTNAQRIEQFDAWAAAQKPGKDMTESFDAGTGILGHVLLNRKQFDMFYAPILEHTIRKTEELDKQFFMFSEGSWERFGDFFNQFKKGTLTMMVEEDNIYEIREKYPNICLIGGIDVSLLGNGTPDECVESVKKVIDDLGRDGGLILSPNKMISFENDCKAENLKAICDFVTSYEI